VIRISDIARIIDISLVAGTKELPDTLIEFYGDYFQPYYRFMTQVMSGLLVELGCDNGRGLVSLAWGWQERTQVVGIDHTRKAGIDKAQELFDNIIFLQQDSLPVPEWFDNQDEKISLLHIDTEHSYSMAKAEFEAYQPYLANPAIIIFDDLHAQEDSVLKYFMELPYPKIQDDRMHPVCGWGVVLYAE
jgi:SAM-dependent methyltransferase